MAGRGDGGVGEHHGRRTFVYIDIFPDFEVFGDPLAVPLGVLPVVWTFVIHAVPVSDRCGAPEGGNKGEINKSSPGERERRPPSGRSRNTHTKKGWKIARNLPEKCI